MGKKNEVANVADSYKQAGNAASREEGKVKNKKIYCTLRRTLMKDHDQHSRVAEMVHILHSCKHQPPEGELWGLLIIPSLLELNQAVICSKTVTFS